MDVDGVKFLVNAPCVELHGQKKSAPMVDCMWDCENCGWNPKEKERRLKEGRFVKGKLHFKRRVFNGL